MAFPAETKAIQAFKAAAMLPIDAYTQEGKQRLLRASGIGLKTYKFLVTEYLPTLLTEDEKVIARQWLGNQHTI